MKFIPKRWTFFIDEIELSLYLVEPLGFDICQYKYIPDHQYGFTIIECKRELKFGKILLRYGFRRSRGSVEKEPKALKNVLIVT